MMRLYRRHVGRLTARRADVIIANSESNKGDIIKYFDVSEEKIQIVYEAVDHERFFPINDDETIQTELTRLGVQPPYVLFVSSLWKYKNPEVLIRAFRIVYEQEPQLRLVIAGYIPDPEYHASLLALVEQLNLSGCVEFVGGIKHDDTAWLYRGARMLVYPSLYETFGLPIPEAMACGCPVIVSDSSSLPEVAGDAALTFDPQNDDELAVHILSVINDPIVRNTMIQKGIARAGEFTWRKTAEETLQAYRLTP